MRRDPPGTGVVRVFTGTMLIVALVIFIFL